MSSEITVLASIISKNVDAIQQIYDQAGTTYPSLSTATYDAESAGDKLLSSTEVLQAAMLAISAASQLVATLKLPGLTLIERATGHNVPAALRIVSECAVVEILREAGTEGAHIDEIAGKAQVDAGILARALRLLATHYVFKEVKPNVFANNRLSSFMDTGKSSKVVLSSARRSSELTDEIIDVHPEKYTDTNGIPALIATCTEEAFKASAFMPDVVLANQTATSSGFERGFKYPGTLFDFYGEYPGYAKRLQSAMVGFSVTQPKQLLQGFDWSSLPHDALVVDVGGGNGSQSFEIAKHAPHLKFIVQDHEHIIENVAKPTWQSNPAQKTLIDKGRISFQVQDFFKPQAGQNEVGVFFLRCVTHDWPISANVTILAHLHAAASSQTKLIIVDRIVPYACPSSESTDEDEDGTSVLLGNLGEANSEVYHADWMMGALFPGAQERTIGEFERMVEAGGWKVEKIYESVGSTLSQILCVKA